SGSASVGLIWSSSGSATTRSIRSNRRRRFPFWWRPGSRPSPRRGRNWGLGRRTGWRSFNPHHDEAGRFTDAGHAVEPRTHEHVKPDRGVEVAFNEFGPTMNDAGFHLPTSESTTTDRPRIEPIRDIKNHQHDVPTDA